MHKFQRSLIPSFKYYNLNKKKSNLAAKMQLKSMKTYPAETLVRDFDAQNNVPDNMILQQITGRRYNNDDCNFSDSSNENDVSIIATEYTNSGERVRNDTLIRKLYPKRTPVYSHLEDRNSDQIESGFAYNHLSKKKTVMVTSDPQHTLITPAINEEANESDNEIESSYSSDD